MIKQNILSILNIKHKNFGNRITDKKFIPKNEFCMGKGDNLCTETLNSGKVVGFINKGQSTVFYDT